MLSRQEVIERVNQRFKCRTKRGSLDGPQPHHVHVNVYGHHASYVEGGFRVWGFESEEGRNFFVSDFDAEVIP
jgi:hypothetical protein